MTIPGSTGINAITVQTDRRIVAVGAKSGDAVVARFTEAGVLDPSFGGGDGIVTTDFFSSDVANDVLVQPNGLIAAAGGSAGDFVRFARYEADGDPDPGFGLNGKVITSFGSSESASALVRSADGSLLAGGTSNDRFALARYEPDGDPDPTFGGGDGQVTGPSSSGTVRSLALRADGTIVAAGGRGSDFKVARYEADGDPDPLFGGGLVTVDFAGTAFDVVIAGDDVVAAGFEHVPYGDGGIRHTTRLDSDLVLASLKADGSLEPGFGAGGKLPRRWRRATAQPRWGRSRRRRTASS